VDTNSWQLAQRSLQLRTIARQLKHINLQCRHSTDSEPHRSQVSGEGMDASAVARGAACADASRGLFTGFDIPASAAVGGSQGVLPIEVRAPSGRVTTTTRKPAAAGKSQRQAM
jgi:hypothetical protein